MLGEEIFISDAVKSIAEPKNTRDYTYTILTLVPLGCTITYSGLGKVVGKHPRTIATYMRLNKHIVIIPCHRVVSKRDLGGYSLGQEFKKRILTLEGALSNSHKLLCRIDDAETLWSLLEKMGEAIQIEKNTNTKTQVRGSS